MAGTWLQPRAPSVYIDAAIYGRELERIFYGPHWSYVRLEIEVSDVGCFKWGGPTVCMTTLSKEIRSQLFCHEPVGLALIYKDIRNPRTVLYQRDGIVFARKLQDWGRDVPRTAPQHEPRRHNGCEGRNDPEALWKA